MHLVQILLPLYDNDGRPLPKDLYRAVAAELTERFGGLTAYTRAPAEGLWKEGPATTARDDVVIYEVMADRLDRAWWRDYRAGLETRFRQEQVVVRAQAVERL
jgi:streptogramin lyase